MNTTTPADSTLDAHYLQSLLQETPVAVTHLNAIRDETGRTTDFQFAYINAAGARIGGNRTPAEVIGRRWSELFPNALQNELYAHYLQIIETGVATSYEQPYFADGINGWFQVSASRHGDGVLSTVVDISERKRTEDTLQKAANTLQPMLDGVTAAVSLMRALRDEQGTIIDFVFTGVNQPSADTLGRPAADLVGQRAMELFPGVRELFFDDFVAVTETGISRRFERYYNGEHFNNWFDVSIVKNDDGIVLVYQDITAQRQVELERLQQAEKLQAIMDTTQTSIHLFRPYRDETGQIIDFVFTSVNPAFARYAGVEPSVLIGRRIDEWFPGYKSSGLFERYCQVYETGQPQRFETHYIQDGLDVWTDAQVIRAGDEILISHTDFTPIKRAELEKQRQAEQLKFVTDSALTAIGLYSIVRDPETSEVVDLRYELINGHAEQMTRRKAEELVGRTMREVFPGIEQSGIWAKYKRLAETGEQLRYHNHYTFDGYDLWYEVQGVRKDEFIVLSFLDITELKQAQEFNQKQAEEFKQVLDNALTAISHFTAVRDERGQIIDFVYQSFNRISEQITGLAAEQVIGRRMLELFPGVRTSGVFDRWVHLVETGHSVRFQDYYEHDGLNFWFDTQSVKWGDGFIQSYIDISQIKQAELAQQKQAELLNAVLDAAQTAICYCPAIRNEQGKTIDFGFALANRLLLKRVNMTADELYARTLCEINPALRNSPAFDEYVRVLETGEAITMERPVLGRWYYVSVVKFSDGMLASLIDITENHQYREQIEAANAELSRSNENLESFAYVASHDLQEPLRKIQSFSDLVIEQYGSLLPEPGIDMLRRMQSAAGRMSDLIRDLLALSRLSTRQQAFERTNLNQVLAGVLSDLETTIDLKSALIEVDHLPTVRGDALQLRQAFQNLLSNALKFAQPGQAPHIRIICQHMPASQVPVNLFTTAWADDNKLTPKSIRYVYALTVSDNGIGFDADQYGERVFGAFQRLQGRTSPYQGTGIGLAIVKKVAQNHYGAVSVASRVGEGAAFTLYLPTDDSQFIFPEGSV